MNKDRQKSHTGGERIQLHLYNRLRVIHQIIANQNYPTAHNLAETLEVNIRTVRRYIAFMHDSFGAPIKFDSKRKGFCYTHPNWEMPLVPFFIASVALQGTGSTYEDERLRRAVAKIAGSLPEAVSVSLGYLFENTSFQPPPHVLVAGQTLDVLHKPVAFFVMPVFALCNTEIIIGANWAASLTSSNSLGIITGLLLGKVIGIGILSFIAVKLKICRLPRGLCWNHIIGSGFLAGIGFTMSIFITNLAFKSNAELINSSIMAILLTSLTAGIIGYLWFMFFSKVNADEEDSDTISYEDEE